MRDKERINRIINLVRRIWKKNPDLRFGQLVENCFDSGLHDGDIYYVEDNVMEKSIRKTYRKDL